MGSLIHNVYNILSFNWIEKDRKGVSSYGLHLSHPSVPAQRLYRRSLLSGRPSALSAPEGPSPAIVTLDDQTTPFATCTESCWIGMWSKYWIVDWPRPVQFYGVHFKPAGMYPFLRLPLSELHNQVVPMDAIWGHLAAKFRERLSAAPTVQAGLTLLEQLLLTRLADAPYGLDVVQHAIAQIGRQHGALSIRAISDQIGISQNHLLTQFKRMVGVPPKDIARILRFAHIVCSLDPAKTVDWERIVHRSRFYDLSHPRETIWNTGNTHESGASETRVLSWRL